MYICTYICTYVWMYIAYNDILPVGAPVDMGPIDGDVTICYEKTLINKI